MGRKPGDKSHPAVNQKWVPETGERVMTNRMTTATLAYVALLAGGLSTTLGACTPTVRVEVAPINIYAKLDADVRIRLDKEVKSAVQQNPNLF